MQADLSHRGCIITFYSYKGGTGRTMALANVACLFADAGDEVLVLDWDLEAPGLHRFLPPRLRTSLEGSDLGLDDKPGIIDLFISLRDQLPATLPSSEDEADKAVERAFGGIDLDTYVCETAVPHVHIMRAGRNDDGGYSRRVGTFDWEDVFKRAPDIYRAFADRLAANYKWVLVDSRTGVTDISGICTSLLPERLVVVFTPNRQSLTGVRELVQRATEYRRASDDLRPLLVYPLPSRIEASLQDLRARWRFGDPNREVIGYEPMFEDLMAKSYGLPKCDMSGYFDEVQIQQTPDYAYGEEIAVRRSGDRFSMANSYVVFANRLKTGEPPWRQVEPSVLPAERPTPIPVAKPAAPPKISSAPPRVRQSPARQVSKDRELAPGTPVFLSYAHSDRERVMAAADALSRRDLRVQNDKVLEAGRDYSSIVSRQLDESEAVVVFWSRDSVESAWVNREAEEGLRRGILVPVLLDDVAPPLAFRSVQSADLRRPTPEALEKLADAVARVAAGTPGTVAYSTAYQSPPDTAIRTTGPIPRRRAIPFAVAAIVLLGVGWFALSTYRSTAPDPEVTAPAVQSPPSATQMVTVPDFVGRPSVDLKDAENLIGLRLSMTDERGTRAPFLEGVVTKQSPPAGTSVERLSQVELEVASKTVTVPTLVGTTLNSALTTLNANRLQLGLTSSRQVSDVKPGTIVEQSPRAGALVPTRTNVDVVVALAPDVVVPNVIGLDVRSAQAMLARSRLTVRIEQLETGGRIPSGQVVRQSPAAGTRITAGASVQLFVARPVPRQ